MLAGLRALLFVGSATVGPVLVTLLFSVNPEGLLQRGRRQRWTAPGALGAILIVAGVCTFSAMVAPSNSVVVSAAMGPATTLIVLGAVLTTIRAWWVARRPCNRWKALDIQAILAFARQRCWVVEMRADGTVLRLCIVSACRTVWLHPQPSDVTPATFVQQFRDEALRSPSIEYMALQSAPFQRLRLLPLAGDRLGVQELP